MTTWKENNLLREAEEPKVYWRWHTGIINKVFKDKLVIALGAPREDKFNVLLRNSSTFRDQEYATFNTREEAEEFAAKAFPNEDGEAYPTKSNLNYYEVDTKFGKCLASEKFFGKYAHRISNLNINQDEALALRFKADLREKCRQACASSDYFVGHLAAIPYEIESLIDTEGKEVAEKVVQRHMKYLDPAMATLNAAAFYYPEDLKEVYGPEDLLELVIKYLKEGIVSIPAGDRWGIYHTLDVNTL